MKQGKHVKYTPKKRSSIPARSLTMLIALALVLTLAIGGTVAFLKETTAPVNNSFAAAGAPVPEIEEDFPEGGTVKQNVTVSLSNSGSGAYFVRAAIVITLQDDAGNTVAKVPVSGTDYTISMGDDWTEQGGYWYYEDTVLPGGETTNLIDTCSTLNSEYKLVVDIIAQTIQAEPTKAAQEQWGYVPGQTA